MNSPIYELLGKGLSSGLIVVVLSWLARSAKTNARREGCGFVVEYGRAAKGFVVFFWLPILAGTVATLWAGVIEPFAGIGFFTMLVLPLHLEFFHVSVRYDQEGLHLRSPWRKNRTIPWSALRAIRFSSICSWHVILTEGHGRIRLSTYLSGLDELLGELERRGLRG